MCTHQVVIARVAVTDVGWRRGVFGAPGLMGPVHIMLHHSRTSICTTGWRWRSTVAAKRTAKPTSSMRVLGTSRLSPSDCNNASPPPATAKHCKDKEQENDQTDAAYE